MKQVFSTSYLVLLYVFLITAWATTSLAEKQGDIVWVRDDSAEVAKIGATAFTATIPETKTVCGVMMNKEKNVLIISADIFASDGHYLFLGTLITSLETDYYGKLRKKVTYYPEQVLVKIATANLWIPTLDITPRRFEEHCPKKLLMKLHPELQELFGKHFGMGGNII